MSVKQLHSGIQFVSALGHSPKIVPDVQEFTVQFGQFVRDDFWKPTLYGDALVFLFYNTIADWPNF